MSQRKMYQQTSRRLVLALDVGTTFSGVSYSILDPGQIPGIQGVTKFPAQEKITGASKIPTIIYYDQTGNVRAVGAEAVREGIYDLAEEENWVKAEWFKLHLRSEGIDGARLEQTIPPLPLNKTVDDIFGDYLRYLFDCASRYIQETHANGPTLWASLENNIDFVLSHPNGWEGKEQNSMRRAAVLAGLITDSPAGQARVSFVTEGEASLHFAIESGVLVDANIKGEGVVIVDAGGGTIDVSTYRRNVDDTEKLFEEIAAAQCHFYGSVFVNTAAKTFLKDLLACSPFLEDVDHILECFDRLTKPRFRNTEDPQFIKFGSARDNDLERGIKFGQLKLLGSDVAMFFEPSVQCIIDSVLSQQRSSQKHTISHVVLVGGFAASDYLFERVDATLSKVGLTVIRPESYVNKAVSDGAISFFLDCSVRARVAKVHYGTMVAVQYNELDPDHELRAIKKYLGICGRYKIPGAFQVILPKDTKVLHAEEFRCEFQVDVRSLSELAHAARRLWCYRGSNTTPRWTDIDTANYNLLCTISPDLSGLPTTSILNPSGDTFYRGFYSIVLLFGKTEIQAQVAWVENGIERRGPVKIIYD